MHQDLFDQKKLFGFTKPLLVVYVENIYNAEVNAFIKSNYSQIVTAFNANSIDFCYLPYLLQNKRYQTLVDYNRPYLHSSVDQLKVQLIYDRLLSKQENRIHPTGFLLFSSWDASHQPIVLPINDSNSSLNEFLTPLKSIADYNDKIRDNFLSYNIEIASERKPKRKGLGEVFAQRIFKETTFDLESEVSGSSIVKADDTFQEEAFQLADEIRNKIKLLNEFGSLALIGDVIEEIQGATKKLSVLFITNDYRIFLKDYNMKEVQMSPLPKSLFILFLRHPEGILFKQLSNYHDELLSIYRNITVHENIDRVKESIRAMTDPLNNSINEKCSRIRAAFLEVIADELAQNYYVTGKRGEPKMIVLNRSLVEFK